MSDALALPSAPKPTHPLQVRRVEPEWPWVGDLPRHQKPDGRFVQFRSLDALPTEAEETKD